jgi:putative chitinase
VDIGGGGVWAVRAVNISELKEIMPYAVNRAEKFLEPLNDAMDEFEINTPLRQSAFLAQLAHESGSLRYVEEIASGAAYEGRSDLGNTQEGDGKRFKGRGLIQITGRANYAQCGAALGLPLLEQPELLEETVNACRSAAWFWHSRKLNELADAGEFRLITKRINGGLNGFADRQNYYNKAKETLHA